MSDKLDVKGSDVSVLIPAFKAGGTIERALNSIAAQTIPPGEVVVVDDGSDDGTFEAAEACREILSPSILKVIRQINAGAGAARNRAIENATGLVLAFLDADDDWLPEHLESSLQAMNDNNLTLVAHNEWLVENGVERLNDSQKRLNEQSDAFLSVYCKGCISTSTVLVKRDAVIAAGGFDPSLANGQDVDLWLTILSQPETKFTILRAPLSRYYVRPGSVNSQTARRFRFFVFIARRWSVKVSRHSRGGLRLLWFRMSAIHYEAVRSFIADHEWMKATGICLLYPLNLIDITIRRFVVRSLQRPKFLAETRPDAKPSQLVKINPFIETAEKARRNTVDCQGRNQVWWETKPMTYADWGAEERLPKSENELFEIEAYVRRTGPWLMEWFERAPIYGKSCIDIGCGTGIFSSMLSNKGGRVVSIDLTETGISLARRISDAFDIKLALVRCDIEKMPFKSQSFDFAFSWGVLHHTADMEGAIGQMSRILKPGGQGIMMVYHKNSIVYYFHGLYWLLVKGKIFTGYSLETVQDFYSDGFYHRYLTSRHLRIILMRNGLRVNGISITQYEKKILPMIPNWLDHYLKARFGMCLIAEFEKPLESM